MTDNDVTGPVLDHEEPGRSQAGRALPRIPGT